MARVCLFDVNETLLDLGTLDPHFERAFGDAGGRRAWFLQHLQSGLVATVTGAYSDFGQVGGAALEMVAERQSVRLTDEDRELILGGSSRMPPHPEVAESLERLRDAGLRLANSTQQVAEAQTGSSGLRGGLRSAPGDGARPLGRAP
jgi:2-haloacid dehalogenase